jgi:PAS domain S-box-containing protein
MSAQSLDIQRVFDADETQYLRQVIEDSPYAVAMFDSEMRYLYASERWSLDHDIKLSKTQLRGRCHYDVFRDVSEHWKNVHQRALAGEVVREESEVRHPADGALQWWLWEVRPWFGLDNKVHGILIYTEDISATKFAHEAIRASEARFRSTFENAAVGISHVGLDASWLRVNDKLCSIIGYTREELLTLTVMNVTHPDDRAADMQAAEQLIAGTLHTFVAEKRYIRRDRSVVWVSVTVSLMRTPDGQPDYYISFVTDIGARKAATLALRESEARFRALADNMSQLAWIADETGARFWFNRRWT